MGVFDWLYGGDNKLNEAVEQITQGRQTTPEADVASEATTAALDDTIETIAEEGIDGTFLEREDLLQDISPDPVIPEDSWRIGVNLFLEKKLKIIRMK